MAIIPPNPEFRPKSIIPDQKRHIRHIYAIYDLSGRYTLYMVILTVIPQNSEMRPKTRYYGRNRHIRHILAIVRPKNGSNRISPKKPWSSHDRAVIGHPATLQSGQAIMAGSENNTGTLCAESYFFPQIVANVPILVRIEAPSPVFGR